MDWVPCGAPLVAVSKMPDEERMRRGSGREDVLLPPPKRLIAKHPLPLTINIIIHRTISEDQVVLIMRIEAAKRVRFGVSETRAEVRNDSLFDKICVSIERNLEISASLGLPWLPWSAWSRSWLSSLAWRVTSGGGGDRVSVWTDTFDSVAVQEELRVTGRESVRLPLPRTILNDLSEVIILKRLKSKLLL